MRSKSNHSHAHPHHHSILPPLTPLINTSHTYTHCTRTTSRDSSSSSGYTSGSGSGGSSLSRSLSNHSTYSSCSELATIPEEVITPLNGKFQSAEADLVLVANDGLSFRVDIDKLIRASPVFERLITISLYSNTDSDSDSISNSSSISYHHQHDNALSRSCSRSSSSYHEEEYDLPSSSTPHLFLTAANETSMTVSLFLHLVYSIALPCPPSPSSFGMYELLLVFMKSYDCSPALLRELGLVVRGWVEDGKISASKGFAFGCQLGISLDSDCGSGGICEESVKRSNEWTWASPTTMSSTNKRPFSVVTDGIFPAPSLDLSAMPFDYFKTIPDEHKFALLRATRNVCASSPKSTKTNVGVAVALDGGCDWDKVAEEYQRILGEIYRSTA
ncbi:hypothetical protein CI109_100568 [Kwoniella shandongensis]|uniref:Uncharacterized protein n=1 Tax=Kwoniella shandongensis TaxID=1734106 RepID=A0A5M6C2X9_9TREE|nr:uncharacterized protein CI109_003511 [Kwoniella shandongensis]KAA5528222.1 hypothetical protein CI109_003511 [Kwoniella shandongensis]